jgi:hypothetical protein
MLARVACWAGPRIITELGPDSLGSCVIFSYSPTRPAPLGHIGLVFAHESTDYQDRATLPLMAAAGSGSMYTAQASDGLCRQA